MAQTLQSYPPNEPILLGSELRLSEAEAGDNGQVRSDGKLGSFSCQAWLCLAPRPSLELVSREEPAGRWPRQAMEGVPTLAWGAWGHGNRGQFYWNQWKRISGDDVTVVETVWHPARQPILVRNGRDISASEIRFHVINFRTFSGRGDEVRQGQNGELSRHGRVRVDAGPWRIEFSECGNFRDILDELAASRGFAVTHQGRIVRTDGERIDTEEACLLLRALDDFLSFARGASCSLALVRAVAGDEEVVWEQWGCRRVDPWRRFCSSWFDSQEGHTLGAAFPGFWDVYSGCREERRALHQAIYWYLRSDSRQSGVDGGLILMQAALERLAHTFYRPKRGNEERTACWLREALAHRQIPVEIPSGSEALATYVDCVVKKNEVRDAVFAVTKLRNNAVHPKEDAPVADGAYFQAWELARWLVELTVLSVIGYKGTYANRLTREFEGQVEVVPWAGSCAIT